MLKVLIVKTTSMGDLIHSMPAITDLQRMRPDTEVHWLVEEVFADIPQWHPFVKKVHICAIRRWRKSFFTKSTQTEIHLLKKHLLAENFDLVIDAQGLLKSALMVRWFTCPRHGYEKNSIKEKQASYFYTNKHIVSRELAAVERVRQLFAKSLAYSLEGLAQQFGLQVQRPNNFTINIQSRYAVFLHGTNWSSKVWPVEYWNKLAEILTAEGWVVYIPWGSDEEFERAQLIAKDTQAVVLDRQSLNALAFILQNAAVVIGSDTGLNHLAAALDTKTIGIYGATSASLTGLVGKNVINIQSDLSCSPCFKRDCPLVKEGEMIPCYVSINEQRVLKEIRNICGE